MIFRYVLIVTTLAATLFGAHVRAETTLSNGVRNLPAQEAIDATGDFVILDVRTESEYEAGHIPEAMNIDVTQASFSTAILEIDPRRTYIVHCGANVPNGRAERALTALHDAGFRDLVNLEGGYAAWVKAGGPVVAPE